MGLRNTELVFMDKNRRSTQSRKYTQRDKMPIHVILMCLRFSSRRHKSAPIDYRLTWYTTFRSAIPTLRCRHAKPSEVIKKEFPIKIHYNVLNGNWVFLQQNERIKNGLGKHESMQGLYNIIYVVYCLQQWRQTTSISSDGALAIILQQWAHQRHVQGFIWRGETFYKQRGVKIKRRSRCSWTNRRPFFIK